MATPKRGWESALSGERVERRLAAILAACYAQMGWVDDAREIVQRLRATTSLVMPVASYLRNAEHRELYLSGLRLAVGEAEGSRRGGA